MKITFINPLNSKGTCASLPPLGLMYLAGYLKQNGYKDISILDLDLKSRPTEEIRKSVAASDVVGVSAFTTQLNEAVRISKICKEERVFSVIGGVHTIALPLETLENSYFDAAVTGEGELTFLELIRARQAAKDFRQIQGLAYRSGQEFLLNPDRGFINDLDALPFPAWDLVPIYDYHARREFFKHEYTIMITSRGCPSACTFCQSPVTWKRKTRFRSVENIFAEIKQLHQRYGFKSIFIEDDTFTLDRARVIELCDAIIASGMRLEFACGTRPTVIDQELLFKMKQAGWVRISMGAESGNDQILKRAKKGYSSLEIRQAAALVRKSGISLLVYMIIGLPGEKLRTYWQSIIFARSLKADQFQWTILVPFPGTEIYKEKQVKLIDRDYANWTYWHPVIKVGRLGPGQLICSLRLAEWLTQKPYINYNLAIALMLIIFVRMPLSVSKFILKKSLNEKALKRLKKIYNSFKKQGQ